MLPKALRKYIAMTMRAIHLAENDALLDVKILTALFPFTRSTFEGKPDYC